MITIKHGLRCSKPFMWETCLAESTRVYVARFADDLVYYGRCEEHKASERFSEELSAEDALILRVHEA